MIEALGVGPVDCFGTSGGAVNLLALAAAHPGDVRPRGGPRAPHRGVPARTRRSLLDVAARHEGRPTARQGNGPAMAKFIALVMHDGELTADYLEQPARAPDPAMFGMSAEDDGDRDQPADAQHARRATTTRSTSTRSRPSATGWCIARRRRVGPAAAPPAARSRWPRCSASSRWSSPSDHGGFLAAAARAAAATRRAAARKLVEVAGLSPGLIRGARARVSLASMPVVVVTDSTASLPPEVADKRGIVVVPLQVVIGADVYDEGSDGATPELVAAALKEFRPVSTSRPTPAALLEVYEECARRGATEIVSVHLSSDMSGTFESAQLAAREAPVPVVPVDSRQVGVATGYAALSAADVVDAGGSAEEAAEAARDRAERLPVAVLRRHAGVPAPRRPDRRRRRAARRRAGGEAAAGDLRGPGREPRAGAHLGAGAGPARGAGGAGRRLASRSTSPSRTWPARTGPGSCRRS